MSVSGLSTPFQRLAALPQTMNWRGVWSVTENYLLNDVVEDTTNNSTYILTGIISIVGGPNPVLSPNWSELSGTSVGVAGVTAGPGIFIDNSTPSQPQISNTGVLQVQGGVGVVVDNTDPQKPIIDSTAIQQLAPGPGISINSANPLIPVIGNNGVRQIIVNPGTGLLSTGGSTPTLVNTGVITVGAGVGIQTTQLGGAVQITNTGVATLTQGTGISITGPSITPTIANAGVITIASGDSTITVDNTDPQNPIVTGNTNTITQAYASTTFVGSLVINPATGGVFSFVPTVGSIFADYFLNGPPEATGIFMLDLTSISFNLAGGPPGTVIGAGNTLDLALVDSTGNAYVSSVYLNNIYIPIGTAVPVSGNFGQFYIDITAARAAGVTAPTGIRVINNTIVILALSTYGNGYAQYFPLGLQ
jgi:hypothetical protein